VAQAKWRDCLRCGTMFVETKEEMERRFSLDSKLLCEECLEEFEKVKVERNLGKYYYIGRMEPCCW
jgi:cytochrome c